MRRAPTLTAMLVLALAACGGDGAETDTGKDTATATDTHVDDTTGEVGDTGSPDPDATATTDPTDTTTTPTDATDPTDTTTPTDATTTTDSAPPTDAPDPDDGDAGDAGDTSAPPTLAGPCPLAVRLGGFQAVDDGEYGYVDGTVNDTVLPVNVLEVVATEGDCTLYKRTNPFCEPTCGPTEACDFDGTCVPHPEPQDLGTATVTGLEGGPVVMTPVQPGNLYYATEIPYPPWTPGALVTLVTSGGAFPAMTLHGVAPDALDPSATQWTITTGEALVVGWDAPVGAATSARVELSLLIDQHGNAPASLRCDFADDGQGTVPASVIDQLRAAGVSGFPTGKLVRQTVDRHDVGATPEAGCMDFTVRSPRNIKVVVSGHLPCTKDQDCPPGKTCNEPIETCVDQ